MIKKVNAKPKTLNPVYNHSLKSIYTATTTTTDVKKHIIIITVAAGTGND